MSENTIIWIEDKDEDDIHQNLTEWCKQRSYQLIKVNDLLDMAEILAEIEEKQKSGEMINIKGFIVDLLLSGPNDLSGFNKPNIQWNHLEDDGGLMLIKHVLRSNDFPRYQEIPILVLSVRGRKIPELADCPNLQITKKRDLLNPKWEKEIKSWLQKLSN